ncbi:MAG: Ig-like domain-containing protein [Sedimentisphaerales bacterium]|nr:Ig-like domain-containing protein [Sedimentisphaerales bacterium]
MCKQFLERRVYFIFLFIVLGFLGGVSVQAADIMVITNFSPTPNGAEVCADTKLWITFASTPIVSDSGYLQICKVSDDSVVYQLNLQPITDPPVLTGWPYQINLNGLTLNYIPFAVSGNVLEIHPSTRLDYNTAYYVKMSAGFCTDSSGNYSPAINNNVSWRFTTKVSAPAADHDYLVTADGSGDFCTIQGASDAVVDNDTTRTIIKIKNGNYRELVNTTTSKINMTWLGEDSNTTVICGYNRDAFNSGTDYRMMVKIQGNGLRAYNVNFHNTAPDNSGQAETIRNKSGLQCLLDNCKFLSYQDTLLLDSQTYFRNCYIQGDTDYIWGVGVAYFDNCEIRSMTDESSYLTQPRTPSTNNGFFFVDCNLTSPTGVNNAYFARLFSGYDYAQVVFIDCIMASDMIRPIGWNTNTQSLMDYLRLWEYKSRTPDGTLIDTSSRLNPGSIQLDDANATYWRNVENVFSVNPWNPKVVNQPTDSWSPYPANGAAGVDKGGVTITWAAGAEATSHIVYFGTDNPPSLIGEQTNKSLATGVMDNNTTYYWRIDEKNSAGTTTGTLWSFTSSDEYDSVPPSPSPMTWAVSPYPVSLSIIAMTATTATDNSGVEYYFSNVTDPNHDSGWQDSPTYIDNGLVNNTTYTYKVKARDKSINQNVTADSNEESTTTMRYACDNAPDSDLDGDCQVNFGDFIVMADAWGEPNETANLLINGGFDTVLTPWQLVNGPGAIGILSVFYDGSKGEPAGSAYLWGNTATSDIKNHRFYQIFPVTIGKKYRFSGRWSGNLNDPNSVTRKNWVEVLVAFSTTSPTPSTWGNPVGYYKKQFVAIGNASNLNFSPTSNGIWDWEDITASPNITPYAPPANDEFTATAPYMVVAFNLSGLRNGGLIKTWLDNISINEKTCSDLDVTGDCQLNWQDIGELADKWLTCYRTPEAECWQ